MLETWVASNSSKRCNELSQPSIGSSVFTPRSQRLRRWRVYSETLPLLAACKSSGSVDSPASVLKSRGAGLSAAAAGRMPSLHRTTQSFGKLCIPASPSHCGGGGMPSFLGGIVWEALYACVQRSCDNALGSLWRAAPEVGLLGAPGDAFDIVRPVPSAPVEALGAAAAATTGTLRFGVASTTKSGFPFRRGADPLAFAFSEGGLDMSCTGSGSTWPLYVYIFKMSVGGAGSPSEMEVSSVSDRTGSRRLAGARGMAHPDAPDGAVAVVR
mmetsp:Transcript_73511/g.129570  ORF Transcript_73511/g.129570 Transcript_73511/m.129570 type:complete len:270 (-) Transcript_73511:38-847(-)